MTSMHVQLKRLGVSIERLAAKKGYMREWAWRRAVENNNVWWNKATVAEFLIMLGRKIRIGPMLGRDTVKNRLEKGDGMSFAEFSYPLVQAWDWWHLFQSGCQLQIGGADQFGNLLAGAEAVKEIAKDAHEYQRARREAEIVDDKHNIQVTPDPVGFTVPLLTTSSGEKFGKSAGNAVWLDADMTSVYDLYQVGTCRLEMGWNWLTMFDSSSSACPTPTSKST
jgi:tyrosyl-tRNA synthetase